jgi:hypothetical protein
MAVTWEEVLNPTYNEVTPGSVTPTSGASIAASATGQNRSNQQGSASASNAPPQGNIFHGLLIFAALLAIIMFVVHRFGGDSDDFSNVRASAYNILIISLISLAGIPLWRLATGSLAQNNVPGAAQVNSYIGSGMG